MGLKRKLSDLDLDLSPSSSSTTSSSTYSSRDSPSPSPSQQHAFTFQPQQHPWPNPKPIAPGNASGRTRKRFRDNRPDEQAIYANTFRKLFDAQRARSQWHDTSRHGPLPPPTALPDAMDASASPAPAQPRSQSSLHRFFDIARAPTSNAMPVMEVDGGSSPRCLDCDAGVGEGGGDAMVVDAGGSPWECRACGRVVCDLCAVVDGGMGRECLMCRTG